MASERVDVSERAPDRRDGLTDLHLRRISEWHRIEPMVRGIHLDQPNVVVDVPAHDLGGDAIVVLKLDEQSVGGRDLAAPVTGVRDHV